MAARSLLTQPSERGESGLSAADADGWNGGWNLCGTYSIFQVPRRLYEAWKVTKTVGKSKRMVVDALGLEPRTR